MPTLAEQLARWAVDLTPTAEDVALADRALLDVAAVSVAAREQPHQRDRVRTA